MGVCACVRYSHSPYEDFKIKLNHQNSSVNNLNDNLLTIGQQFEDAFSQSTKKISVNNLQQKIF